MLLLQLLVVVVGGSGRVRRQRRRAFLVVGRRRIAGCSGALRPIAAAVRHVDPHPVVVLGVLQQEPGAAEATLARGTDVRRRFCNKTKAII